MYLNDYMYPWFTHLIRYDKYLIVLCKIMQFALKVEEGNFGMMYPKFSKSYNVVRSIFQSKASLMQPHYYKIYVDRDEVW